jgi:hypothetical protein
MADGDSFIHLGGRSFRCEDCGAKVFHEGKRKSQFICNGCGATYTGLPIEIPIDARLWPGIFHPTRDLQYDNHTFSYIFRNPPMSKKHSPEEETVGEEQERMEAERIRNLLREHFGFDVKEAGEKRRPEVEHEDIVLTIMRRAARGDQHPFKGFLIPDLRRAYDVIQKVAVDLDREICNRPT